MVIFCLSLSNPCTRDQLRAGPSTDVQNSQKTIFSRATDLNTACVCSCHLTCEHPCLHLLPVPGIALSLKADNVLMKSLADSACQANVPHEKGPVLHCESAGYKAGLSGEHESVRGACVWPRHCFCVVVGCCFFVCLFLCFCLCSFIMLQVFSASPSQSVHAKFFMRDGPVPFPFCSTMIYCPKRPEN